MKVSGISSNVIQQASTRAKRNATLSQCHKLPETNTILRESILKTNSNNSQPNPAANGRMATEYQFEHQMDFVTKMAILQPFLVNLLDGFVE
jgi:hypothetical protein